MLQSPLNIQELDNDNNNNDNDKDDIKGDIKGDAREDLIKIANTRMGGNLNRYEMGNHKQRFLEKVYDDSIIRAQGKYTLFDYFSAIKNIIKGMLIKKFQDIVDDAQSKKHAVSNVHILPLNINFDTNWTGFLDLVERGRCYNSCVNFNPDNEDLNDCYCDRRICEFSGDWRLMKNTRMIKRQNKYFCYPNITSPYYVAPEFGGMYDSYKGNLYIELLNEFDVIDDMHKMAQFEELKSRGWNHGHGGYFNHYKKAKTDYFSLR